MNSDKVKQDAKAAMEGRLRDAVRQYAIVLLATEGKSDGAYKLEINIKIERGNAKEFAISCEPSVNE